MDIVTKKENDKLLYKLKNTTFIVSVPKICLYNDGYLKRFGPPMDYIDGRQVPGSHLFLTTVGLPILRILEIFEEGMEIVLIDGNDSKIIYDIIDDYIMELQRLSRKGPNAIVLDLSLAKRLDELSAEISKNQRSVILEEFKKEVEASTVLTFANANDFNLSMGEHTRERRYDEIERKSLLEDIEDVDRFSLDDLQIK